MENNLSQELKKKVFERDSFSCKKCGFSNKDSSELEIHHITPKVFGGEDTLQNLVTLCNICHKYAPNYEKEFLIYLKEKINGELLNTFRKSNNSISKKTKQGMINEFNDGNLVTKAPLGYKVVDKQLIPADNSYFVQEIFQNFSNQDISLTQLSKKYNLSVNGLKKVLTNETYLGKIKFSGKVLRGKHPPLISQELFNKVQNKLKAKGWA